MLKNLIIFAFCIIAINASGELNILKHPNSIAFKGNEKLESESLGDVLAACMGKWVDDAPTKWNALFVIDPFDLADKTLTIVVEGTDHLNFNDIKVKSFKMIGNSAQDSINAASSDMESSGTQTYALDTNQFSESLMMLDDVPNQIAPLKGTNNLKPELHSEDKDLLTKLAYIKELATKFLTSNKTQSMFNIFIDLNSLAKAHGEKSAAMADALKIVAKTIAEITNSAGEDSLVAVVAEKAEANRAKRETVDGASAKDLNLATYYNEDYPVIFNIILWFMVVLAFSVLAICYAIGSMDPGRDSIIYRMTSTRMKKDN
ncbi:ATPase H(+)-transporting accessory protein 2 [Episyrphus balteatus]|uniref:ATPase H(+)-transporting accessory protein 2 n=1 Tax=Episyrphus balteatus TaxID=286459 RepID=UPI002485FE57|nr:ATPase H(+)-transporting accessory protein 2 [Episyrphus balteatus]